MALLFCTVLVSAQGDAPGFSSANRYVSAPSLPIEGEDESVQMNFINQKWSAGTIQYKNSGRTLHLALLFDVFGNKLYFNQGNQIMEFTEPVSEFKIQLVAKGDTNLITYRNGFPPIQRNNEETYYEVVNEGKISLLKCKAKTIYMIREENVPEALRNYSREMYYALLPGNKLVPIKKDKADILKQLPEYATIIEEILKDKKLKIKTDQSLKELFVYLDYQVK